MAELVSAQGSSDRSHGNDAPGPRMPDTEIFHAMPAGSENSTTAIVAFTAWPENGGRHDFFKLLQPLPCSKLLVRDPNQNWYNTGLPGIGDSVEEIAARIREEVVDLGAERTITIGSSMGGYGAILFGCLVGADRVIALAPQTLIDPILQPRFLAPDVSLEVPDLFPIIRDSPDTRIDLVAGWDDHTDVFQAQRVAGLDTVRIIALPGRTHMLTVELNSEGELLPFIAQLIEGGIPEACLVNPKLNPKIEERIAETFFAEKKGEWRVVAERIAPVVKLHPDWPGPNLALGMALAHLHDLEGAEGALARAVKSNPEWVTPRLALIDVLYDLGCLDRAEQTIREGLETRLDGDAAAGHLMLARCLLKQGRMEEARSSAFRARELAPELSSAVHELLEGAVGTHE